MGDIKEEKLPSSESIVSKDKARKPEKSDQPEKPEKTEQSQKPEKAEQPLEGKLVTPKESAEEKLEKVYERTEFENEKTSKEEQSKAGKSDEKPKVEADKTEAEKVAETEQLPIKKDDIKPKESTENVAEKSIKKVSDSVPCCPKPREKLIRNQSDIFSLKDFSTTLQTSIFSVNGSPSRRVFRKQEPAGHVFQRNEDRSSDQAELPKTNRITRENYNDEKRPSSSYRNPLTGTGLSSNDEYKSKGIKRKDGNPLLGLGYDSEVTTVNSQHRVPPGGFAHKLW